MYDAIRRAIVDYAAEWTVPRWTVEALGDVAEGRTAVTAVRHPLGFVCLPLERVGEQGVCVHVWSDRLTHAQPTTLTTSATHAHSWDLISFVLYGALRNELVGVTDVVELPTHRVFRVDSSGHDDQLRWTPRLVRRQTRASELHQRGEVYTLPAGVFHETTAQGETATVALGRGRPGTVDLTLGPVDTDNHRIRRQLCDREETAYVATMVAERVAELVAERLAEVPHPRHQEDRCQRCER